MAASSLDNNPNIDQNRLVQWKDASMRSEDTKKIKEVLSGKRETNIAHK